MGQATGGVTGGRGRAPRRTQGWGWGRSVPLTLVLVVLVGVYVEPPLPLPLDDSVLTFSETRARGASLPPPSAEQRGARGGSGAADGGAHPSRMTTQRRGVGPPPCFRTGISSGGSHRGGSGMQGTRRSWRR
jgi:hypothetical protein